MAELVGRHLKEAVLELGGSDPYVVLSAADPRAGALSPGDPAAPSAGTYGPLSSSAAADTLVEQIQDAVAHGATLHAGGRRQEGDGYYVAPAVLTGVTRQARAEAFAQRLEVGMTHANAPSAERADLPFGGVKRSGFGRELGPLGLDESVNKRLSSVASPPDGPAATRR